MLIRSVLCDVIDSICTLPPNEVFQERKQFQVGDDIVRKDDGNPPPFQSVTKFRGTLFFFNSEKNREV